MLWALLTLLLCTQTSTATNSNPNQLLIGSDVLPTVAARWRTLLTDALLSTLTPNSIISVGNTTLTQSIIPNTEKLKAGPEGFIIRSKTISNGSHVLAVAGNPPDGEMYQVQPINRGVLFGGYEALWMLGFSFLHPLQPFSPQQLSSNWTHGVDITQAPRWGFRTWHVHTEHPLELTNLFQGWGPDGWQDKAGWDKNIYRLNFLYEWLLANKQNGLETVLLCAEEWKDFCTARFDRIKQINDMGHAYGIFMGVDMPIANIQQHAWHMINSSDPTPDTLQIKKRLDWLMSVDYDFVNSENGYSEFTHGSCKQMLDWMNTAANYLKGKYGKTFWMKCHCSSGQTCPDYPDPRTGKPVNFNFLPMFANDTLGVCPHTVQLYNFNDPTTSYGNTNFTYMFDFLTYEIGKRPVMYHPETAYWVSYDILVPLFLPLYGLARVTDLRMIANWEKTQPAGRKMNGQDVFSSGWEWGYWLNDFITANAVWDPRSSASSDIEATKQIMLKAFTNVFGETQATKLVNIIADYMTLQHNTLVLGKQTPTSPPPSDIKYRNGMAYLEGWKTWAEMAAIAVPDTCTQPLRLSLNYLQMGLFRPEYKNHVRPLLKVMEDAFLSTLRQTEALQTELSTVDLQMGAPATAVLNEIIDSLDITYQRASQLVYIYDYVSDVNSTWANLNNALNTIHKAAAIVHKREQDYRVPVSWIAGYDDKSPTCYEYRYLWTAHSNYFMWRDYARAAKAKNSFSPCFMNIDNPYNTGIGEGGLFNVTKILRKVLDKLGGLKDIGECLSFPAKEPHYPQNLN